MGATTPILGLPYPEPDDDTRTWRYWQDLAESVESVINAPGLAAFMPAGINLPQPGVGVPVPLDRIEWERGGFTYDDFQWTVPKSGIYTVSMFAEVLPFAENFLRLTLNAAGDIRYTWHSGASHNLTAILALDQGDRLSMRAGTFTAPDARCEAGYLNLVWTAPAPAGANLHHPPHPAWT